MNALLRRAETHDHEWFGRLQLSPRASATHRRAWSFITHAGGATTTLVLSLIPLFAEGSLRVAAERSLALLVASHVVVQVIKRSVSRPRPVASVARVRYRIGTPFRLDTLPLQPPWRWGTRVFFRR